MGKEKGSLSLINYPNERKSVSDYVMNLPCHWRKGGGVNFLF